MLCWPVMKLVRTQVYLEEAQYERLRAEAYRRKATLSRVLREMLDQAAGRGRRRPPLDLRKIRGYIGCARGGIGDLSVNHDRYAWGEEWSGRS